MDPVAFHARVLAATDAEGRLPLGGVEEWDIFPYEREGLRCKVFAPLAPEPPRAGDDPATCRCADGSLPSGTVWADERWSLSGLADAGIPTLILHTREHLDVEDLDDAMAADLGVLIVRISRALMAVDGVGRVHVDKWGDGSAHLHVWFWARPAGVLQLRGSTLPDWEELLPRLPVDELDPVYAAVATALAGCRGAVA